MSDKNLLIGDTTYPHTPEPTLSMLLRCNDDNGLTLETDLLMSEAADRIEQLERQVTEAQKGHERYEYVRKLSAYQFQKIFTMNLTSAIRFDDLIDAAINGVKA
jgi:hypothetical protein